ncbi:hypothetical protein [Caulobacter sp. FWC2]|uniref:hypothetical protein n=1 Tax=Caulobacter sp. FWC2 TaxID=69664 RepID=UPI000C151C97|nr:hypothetical protein [Caulobacter sp. FWC2]PIB94165.1 hypothetical protein CSW62_22855 [Caulobacter sp. FWC2]
MEFLLTIMGVMTLCMLRPHYNEFKSGKYRPSKSVWLVVILVVFSGLSWVGALAWDHSLPPYLSQGLPGVITGSCGALTFAALFVIPALLSALLAQTLTGTWWIIRGRPSA